MNGTITLKQAAFGKLLDGVLYPDPDRPTDPGNPWGPYGPAGPVIHGLLSEIDRVLLNPQPLPPRERFGGPFGPVPDPWRALDGTRFGPFPEPWRLAISARGLITQAVSQYQWAQATAAGDGAERTIQAIRSRVQEVVDDWCATPPRRRWPLPWPPPFEALRPVDLFLAGAQFQRAADALGGHPLQAEFAAAADKLFETAVGRMEGAESASPQAVSAP